MNGPSVFPPRKRPYRGNTRFGGPEFREPNSSNQKAVVTEATVSSRSLDDSPPMQIYAPEEPRDFVSSPPTSLSLESLTGVVGPLRYRFRHGRIYAFRHPAGRYVFTDAEGNLFIHLMNEQYKSCSREEAISYLRGTK